jgi:hypothetical protein
MGIKFETLSRKCIILRGDKGEVIAMQNPRLRMYAFIKVLYLLVCYRDIFVDKSKYLSHLENPYMF